MISAAVIEALKEIVPADKVLLQEPMKLHTTFRIGGPADCLVYLENEEQLCKIQKYLRLVDVPYTVIGNGSNLLVSDQGYAGIVLVVGKHMSRIEVRDCYLEAEAGALMSQVAKAAKEHGLTGLEFAAGIPGTIGGGAVMNAGAYGGEMSQVVTTVTVVNRNGEIMELDNSTMEYGYRTSVIQNQSFVVTKVTFRLQPGDPEQIAAKMEELAIRRREKQPLEYPSAGSTFKRPEGHFARAADHGSRSAGILRRRRKGIGKALRIYYQHRQCHCRRCKRCDLGSTEKSERTFSRGAGTRDQIPVTIQNHVNLFSADACIFAESQIYMAK